MKVGAAYIVFDGTELLERSIDQIRQHVDFICVVYQRSSWFGKPVSGFDLGTVKSLRATEKIDRLVEFTAFRSLQDKSGISMRRAKSFERDKRQLGLRECITNGCTHFLCMDVDEFYDPTQFLAAKNKIIEHDYAQTACKFINYVNIPTVHRGYDSKRVPFICKVNSESQLGQEFFVKCDPTRGIKPQVKPFVEFDASELTMHHMETVRMDLQAKYESTTRSNFKRERIRDLVVCVKEINESSSTVDFKRIIFPGLGPISLTKCANQFDIPYTKWTQRRP